MVLNEVDDHLRVAASHLIDSFQKLKSDLGVNVLTAGSVSEGSMIARMFFPSDGDGTINKEVEVDIELLLYVFNKEYMHMLKPVATKPGYVRLQLNDEVLSNMFAYWNQGAGLNTDSLDELQKKKGINIINEDGFLLSHASKAFYREKTSSIKSTIYDKPAAFVIAAAMNMNPDDVIVERIGNTITKASVETSYSVFVKDDLYMLISIDNVGCCQLQWWPVDAEEWITRKRNWPNVKTIEELSSCCFIIAKPSNEEKDDVESTEWCYSFAQVENQLVRLHSEGQILIYLIAKAIFYR